MCGIVGYIGHRNSISVLIQGLESLEYRGYDSAGLACLNHHRNDLCIIKEKGKLARLKDRLRGLDLTSHIGIAHTRWATHGVPSRANAHPHTDSKGRIALVHNGIIENYFPLKQELRRQGFHFSSETDTEVLANLIGSYYRGGNLVEAVSKAVQRLEGFFAFAVMAKDEPHRLVVFRRSNPLVIGLGKHENFIASDASAILPYTNRVLFLEDDEIAVLTREEVKIFSFPEMRPVRRKPAVIRWTVEQAAKGGYPHFMLKEIYEQPQVVASILKSRLAGDRKSTRLNSSHNVPSRMPSSA